MDEVVREGGGIPSWGREREGADGGYTKGHTFCEGSDKLERSPGARQAAGDAAALAMECAGHGCIRDYRGGGPTFTGIGEGKVSGTTGNTPKDAVAVAAAAFPVTCPDGHTSTSAGGNTSAELDAAVACSPGLEGSAAPDSDTGTCAPATENQPSSVPTPHSYSRLRAAASRIC